MSCASVAVLAFVAGCPAADGDPAGAEMTDTEVGETEPEDASETTGPMAEGSSTGTDSMGEDSQASGPDADPCARCSADATCDNGSCACADGFEGDGETCEDIDECATAPGVCDSNATCTNTPGGFTCVCGDGFEGDGTTCADLDECSSGIASCDANAACTNTDGAYTCACNDGFEGDGFTCLGVAEYGEYCDAPEQCASGLCLLEPDSQCSSFCEFGVANGCADVGARGLCVPAADDAFLCVGDLDTGFDGDDAVLQPGDALTRFFDTLDDLDLFTVSLPGGNYNLVVAPDADDDVSVQLYNAGAQQIGVLSNGGQGQPEGAVLGGPGHYYLVVANEGTSTGAYTISVTPGQ